MKKMLYSFLVAVTMLAGHLLHAAIIEVPADQSTIQAAVDASSSGDTILVAEGTYVENVRIADKNIILASHFLLDRDPSHIFNTIIDGSQPIFADTASTVLIMGTVDTTMHLTGFTLTGGRGTAWLDEHGAGVYREGGGLLVGVCSPTIEFNYIADNLVTNASGVNGTGGGGIRAGDGDPIIRNNVIVRNAAGYGAGVVMNYATGRLINNLIADNFGGGEIAGSGLWNNSGDTTYVINCSIVNNSSALEGSGIYVLGGGKLAVRNTLVWGNTSPGGTQISGSGSFAYCNVETGVTGTGNFSADPTLTGPFYYLKNGSPCIDAGDPAVAYNDQESVFNPGNPQWPAWGTLTNDIGAYGGPGGYPFEFLAAIADTLIGWAPLSVNFETYCYFPTTSFEWDFGDGAMGTGDALNHSYVLSGAYDPFVTADTGGASISAMVIPSIIAIADTLAAATVGVEPGEHAVVEIHARNAAPVEAFTIPVEYSGPVGLSLDSVSVEGCRTNYFQSISYTGFDPFNSRFTVRVKASAGGTLPELTTGAGAILKLHFSVPSSANLGDTSYVLVDGYGSNVPFMSGSRLGYQPMVINGGVAASTCCTGIRGNVDGDALDEIAIGDLTYLVNYMYRGGAAPQCDLEANIDGSLAGDISIADLTLLVGYMFKGGAAPPSCP